MIAGGVDNFRAIYGPLPQTICSAVVFFKNVIYCNCVQFTICTTITRFVFVCIFKSIPVMDDKLVAHYLYASINMVSFIIVTTVSVLPGKMPLNYVSIILV